jgi:hypothetical protein
MAPLPIELEIRHRVKVTVRLACALFVLQRLVWAVSAMGLALLALVATDWGFRGTQPEYRWFLSGLGGFVILAGGFGWGLSVMRWRLTEMQAAWLIEKSQPRLRGYLASSLSLVLHSQSQASDGLVRAALVETQERLKDLQPRRLLKWDRLITGTMTVGLVAGAIGTLVWVAPQFTSIGIARLVSPAEDIRWPSRYQLAFENPPTVVARGVPTRVRIREENGDLPRRVTLQIRDLESGDFQTLAAQGGGRELTVVLPGFESEFEMRALGGDGNTGWRLVRVADPPTIENFELRAQPPECLGLSPVSATGPLRAPEGSSLLCYGRSGQALRSARLILQAEGAELQTLPLQVTEDGYAFFLAQNWILSQDLEYEIEVVADSGLSSTTPMYPVSVQWNAPPILEWSISELDLKGEFYVVNGVVAQIELNAVDDFGLRWLVLEQAKNGGMLPWNRIWETEAFGAAQTGKSRHQFLIDWVPEKSNVESEVRLLRPRAEDRCGLVSFGTERRVKVVTREEYQVKIQTAWENWLASLMPVRREALELRDLAVQMQVGLEGGSTFDTSRIRQAFFRATRLKDETLPTGGALHQRLIDLRDWVLRYNLSTNPAGSRIIELSQAWNEELWPTLAEIEGLWKKLESLPSDQRQDQLEVVIQLRVEQEKLAEFFSSWLGNSERVSFSQWLENLREIYGTQQQLISETKELRTLSLTDVSAGETAAADLSRGQVEVAVSLENLEQELREFVSSGVGSPQEAGLTKLLEALTSQPVAVWQREAARSLNQQKYAASLALQNQVGEVLQEILKLDQDSSFGSGGRRKEAWMSWLESRLGESEGIQNELQVLQHVDNADAIMKRSNELLTRVRQLQLQLQTAVVESDEWRAELQPVLDATLQELDGAERSTVDESYEQSEAYMAAAASNLREGITKLLDEWDLDTQGDSFERQLRSKLKSWAVQQGGIVSDLQWLTELEGLYDEAKVRELLSQRQAVLHQSLLQRPEDWDELNLLLWEIDEIGSEMGILSGKYETEPQLRTLVEPARRIWERLAFLADTEANPSASDPQTDSTSNQERPDGQAERVRRPAGWQVQLAVIRQRQEEILRRTVKLAEQDLELEAARLEVNRLKQEQNQLREQTRRLGEAAAAMLAPNGGTEKVQQQENSVGSPGLPGLPGLGGPQQDKESSPTNPKDATQTDGEDLGEERHPLATIETRMELVSDYFSRYDCSKSNQEVQQAIIDELSNTSSENGPSNTNQQGVSQSSQSQAGDSVGGQAQGVDAAGLLPEELMIRSGIWGHLPPEIQKGVQTLWVDGWIEGYEDASIEYFQELGQRLEGERN